MKNCSIKILDCTLRDGGYVNNWNFGFSNIQNIIKDLDNSGIDFIECGFLRDIVYELDRSLYSNLNDLTDILPDNIASDKIVVMIDYGEFDISKLPNNDNKIFGIRIIFKKNNLQKALEACKEIKLKGYNIFINPTFISQYSKKEFSKLIEKVNEINPYAFSIVDSMGVMRNSDAADIFKMADEKLRENITLCFHSHNNLQLSFSNAQELLNLDTTRNIIIDSSIFGMGRGAGNIKTEFLIQYLNENYGCKYNILPILSLIHNIINPIFERKPWGYSVPYYLAAQSFCHPNYASFLIEKKLPIELIDKILKEIPDENKIIFNRSLIENLYNKTVGVFVC